MYRVEAASPDFISDSEPLPSSWKGGCPSIPSDLFTPEEAEADNAKLHHTSEDLAIAFAGYDPATPLPALEAEELSRFHQDRPTWRQRRDPNPLTLSTFEQVVTARHAVLTTQAGDHPLATEHFEGVHGRYSLLDALLSTDKEGHAECTFYGDDAHTVREALRKAAERKLPTDELRETQDPEAHFDAAAAKVVEELHIPAEEPGSEHDTLTHRIRPLVRRTLAFMLVG